MQTTFVIMIASTKVTEQAENRWTLIVERFRSACILYREGCHVESRRIIKDELPELIRAWIKLLPPSLKEDAKADLRDMFTREQSIVDQGLKLQNIFKETLVKNIIPQVEEQVAAKYRTLYLNQTNRGQSPREPGAPTSWEPAQTRSRSDLNLNPAKRIQLDDVEGMIDAVQEQDSNAQTIADSVVSLDSIVSTLNEAKFDPSLARNEAVFNLIHQ